VKIFLESEVFALKSPILLLSGNGAIRSRGYRDGIADHVWPGWKPGRIAQEFAMSSINGLGGNAPIQKTNTVKTTPTVSAPATASKPSATDKLELSGASHLLAALKTNDVRTDKVAAIRAQIANGTYETDDKIDGATDKLLDEISK
jgi:negative regulator of flagellin synthesis FlgM